MWSDRHNNILMDSVVIITTELAQYSFTDVAFTETDSDIRIKKRNGNFRIENIFNKAGVQQTLLNYRYSHDKND